MTWRRADSTAATDSRNPETWTWDPDPIRPPDTDEAPDFGLQEFTRGVDRANRERARDLALMCFALLAILAIVLWWTQR
jgi:hypothetical protein